MCQYKQLASNFKYNIYFKMKITMNINVSEQLFWFLVDKKLLKLKPKKWLQPFNTLNLIYVYMLTGNTNQTNRKKKY